MRWANPDAFWLILFLPILLIYFLGTERLALKNIQRFLGAQSGHYRNHPKNLWGFIFLAAALLCLILAFARPQKRLESEKEKVTSLDMVIALDVSQSMLSEDVRPSRLELAKRRIQELLDELSGDRVGLVAFAGSAFLASPLTQDYMVLQDFLEALDPRSIGNQGTSVAQALERSLKALMESKSPTGAVILITDAEDHEGGILEAAKKIKEKGFRLYVVGIGTESGGAIPIRNSTGRLLRYKKDRAGKKILSKLNPDSLQEIASSARGKSYLVGDAPGLLNEILKEIQGLERTEVAQDYTAVFSELFQMYLGLGIFFLLLFQLMHFRHSLILPVLILTFLPYSSQGASETIGGILQGPKVNQLADNALEAYRAKDFKKSSKLYQEALEELIREKGDETLEQRLQFNLGMSQLWERDHDSAMQSLDMATRGPDPILRAQAFHNKALGLQSKKQLKEAQDELINSLRELRDLPNHPVAERGRGLLSKLSVKMQEQQQQKKKKKKKGGKGDEEEKKDKKKSEGDKKDEKEKKEDQKKKGEKDPKEKDKKGDKKDEGDEKKQGKGKQKKQKFKSVKLSEKQAKSMLHQMREMDRKLFQRFGRERSKGSAASKDW